MGARSRGAQVLIVVSLLGILGLAGLAGGLHLLAPALLLLVAAVVSWIARQPRPVTRSQD